MTDTIAARRPACAPCPTLGARLGATVARAWLLPAVLALGGLAVGLAGCSSESSAAGPHDLAVDQTVPEGPYDPGTVIGFTVTLVNKGPGDSGPVTLNLTQYVPCVSAGNATCPTHDDPGHLDNIPSGGKLTFTFTETLPADGLGVQTYAFTATSAQDTDASNDSKSFSITMTETRNATYHLFAADGRAYDLVLDFTHAQWTLSGNGADAAGTLTSETVDGAPVYLFGTGGRFRTLAAAIVGEADFGAGSAPFVGAWSFATTDLLLSIRDYVVAARTWNAGVISTGLETLSTNDHVLTTCIDASAVYRMADCPADRKTTYTVTLDGVDFTAVNDADATDVFHFRLALIGTKWVFLRAEADAGGVRRFRLGLNDNTGPAAGSFSGGDTLHHWNAIAIGNDSTWQLTRPAPDDTGNADSATFIPLGGLAPGGPQLATRASDGGSLYLMQDDVLGAIVGTPAGATAGYLMLMGH